MYLLTTSVAIGAFNGVCLIVYLLMLCISSPVFTVKNPGLHEGRRQQPVNPRTGIP